MAMSLETGRIFDLSVCGYSGCCLNAVDRSLVGRITVIILLHLGVFVANITVL